jgi:hypothetical protein
MGSRIPPHYPCSLWHLYGTLAGIQYRPRRTLNGRCQAFIAGPGIDVHGEGGTAMAGKESREILDTHDTEKPNPASQVFTVYPMSTF